MRQRALFIVATFLAWLPVFMIQKPAFMLYHYAQAADCSLAEWALVVLHGLKLDCTLAGYLTALPLLLVLLSIWLPGQWLRRWLTAYTGVMAAVVALIFSADVALYGFWGFRLDATPLFYLRSPRQAMASAPVGLLLAQVGCFAVYTYGIFQLFRRCLLRYTPITATPRRVAATALLVLMGGGLFIPIRGGVTTSTANVGMVYFSRNQFLNHAAINPCFSLVASLAKEQDFASQFNFLPEEERRAVVENLLPRLTEAEGDSIPQLLNTSRPNVLIILLESFTANVVQVTGGDEGVTPCLNRLSEEGILFRNLYASSFRTDRGIVSTLNGYLAQPTTSIMKYPSKSQSLPSIAKSLAREGYVADMLYGGDINFTNMQSYFYGSGYAKVVADRDFPLAQRLSKWGAHDDITFAHLYDDIKGRNPSQPWLTTFLTLSSHEPFEVPYHRLKDPFLNSVAFADSCLGDFIDKFKQLPAWQNSLIVLVADHGYRYPETIAEYSPERHHIPMLWLGGALTSPAVVDTYAAQTDLAATLLAQLHLPHDEFRFSKNIFHPQSPEYLFYTFYNGFGYIDATGTTLYDNESNQVLLSTGAPATTESRLTNGKALLQTLYDDLGSR